MAGARYRIVRVWLWTGGISVMAVPASIGRTVWGDYQATAVLALDGADGNRPVTRAHSR